MIKGNNELVKKINILNIFNILKNGQRSRADISKATGLTPASITKLVKGLIEKDIIKEIGSNKKSSGRPSIQLKINSDLGKVVGVYLAPTKISMVLKEFVGQELKREEFSLEKIKKENILDEILKRLDEFIGKDEDILGIGVALNGIVNFDDGVSIFSPHYKWNNLALREILEKRYEIPTVVENDVRVMALGEYYDNEDSYENFILLNIEEGVGAGIVLQGELYRGRNYSAGEIGHIKVARKDEGALCSCGKRGCLETFISKKALRDRHGETFFKDYLSGENSAEEIMREDVGGRLAYTLSVLSTVVNPEVIYISGEISSCGEKFFKLLKELIEEFSMNNSIDSIKILPSKLQKEGTLVGAIDLIQEKLFKGDILEIK